MADKPKKILIVEDEQVIARALLLKLKSLGVEASEVFDGKAAVEAVEKNNFDVIILDLMLPQLDGFGVLEELKKKGKKTPVVVISKLSQEEDIKRAKDLGANEYFVKSYTSIAEIVDHVKKLLV